MYDCSRCLSSVFCDLGVAAPSPDSTCGCCLFCCKFYRPPVRAPWALEMFPIDELRPTAVLLFVPLPSEKKLLTCCLCVVWVAFRDAPLFLFTEATLLFFELLFCARTSWEPSLWVPKPWPIPATLLGSLKTAPCFFIWLLLPTTLICIFLSLTRMALEIAPPYPIITPELNLSLATFVMFRLRRELCVPYADVALGLPFEVWPPLDTIF